MKDELMKRRKPFMFFAALSLSLVGVLVVYGKIRQRENIAELMKHKFVAVQFSNGEYCESINDVRMRDWLFDTLDVVYFDVPEGSSRESLALLGRLPSLSRVIIRFQGESFEEFRLRRNEIEKRMAAERALVKSAIHDVEVLSFWTVAQWTVAQDKG